MENMAAGITKKSATQWCYALRGMHVYDHVVAYNL